jgi:hypothetical protein
MTGGNSLGKCALGSILDEMDFCSSETKHDRRTLPRPKLLEGKPQPWKCVLGSSPDKVVSVAVIAANNTVKTNLANIVEVHSWQQW